MKTEEQLEQNKEDVISFYDLRFNQHNPKEAINDLRECLHTA